ncbi:MAG: MCE family protein [Acidobacteriota bacterium]|nr:MCE family protein [Acidobacteriota bacterium]
MALSPRRERALVGLFVLVAAGLLVATLFSLSGLFGRNKPIYRAYFNNAGGLGPGSEVRYAGGPPVGRVVSVHPDPRNLSLMEVEFRVDPVIPVKTDSKARISNISPLGDNFLEIVPGTAVAPRAAPGAVLPAMNYTSFGDLTAEVSDLAPQASVLLRNLNARVVELQVTVRRVNELLGSGNRQNLAASLSEVRAMLAENRAPLHSTLNHLDAGSAKLAPLLADFQMTANKANAALSHIDATVQENRPNLRQAVIQMKSALNSVTALTAQLNSLVNANSDNLDAIIDNMRDATDNLRAFTETIKTRPSALIRFPSPPKHEPGVVSRDQR